MGSLFRSNTVDLNEAQRKDQSSFYKGSKTRAPSIARLAQNMSARVGMTIIHHFFVSLVIVSLLTANTKVSCNNDFPVLFGPQKCGNAYSFF